MKAKWRLLVESGRNTNDGVLRRTSGMNLPDGGMVMQVEVFGFGDTRPAVALVYIPNTRFNGGAEDGTELEEVRELLSLTGEPEPDDGSGNAEGAGVLA